MRKSFLLNGGQKGRQAAYLTPGTYRVNSFLFDVTLTKVTQIKDNMVGIVTTLDGAPLPEGQIAGKMITGHNNFQDADAFLANGGSRGLRAACHPRRDRISSTVGSFMSKRFR